VNPANWEGKILGLNTCQRNNPGDSPTPASPEFVSETSAESAAAARVLALWTGSDRFEYTVTISKGSSRIEPGKAPSAPIVLKWATFTEAADEAGMAARYGGIQFALGDWEGKKLGRAVAEKAWGRAQKYFDKRE